VIKISYKIKIIFYMIKINNKYKYKKVKIIKWVSYKQFHIPFIEIAKKINKYTVKEMIK